MADTTARKLSDDFHGEAKVVAETVEYLTTLPSAALSNIKSVVGDHEYLISATRSRMCKYVGAHENRRQEVEDFVDELHFGATRNLLLLLEGFGNLAEIDDQRTLTTDQLQRMADNNDFDVSVAEKLYELLQQFKSKSPG